MGIFDTAREKLLSTEAQLAFVGKNHERAIKKWTQLRALKPDDYSIVANIGWSWFLLGDKEQALKFTEEAIHSDSQNINFRSNKAIILYSLAEWDKAYAVSSEVHQEIDFQQKFNLTHGYICYQLKKYDEAIRTFESMMLGPLANIEDIENILDAPLDSKSIFKYATADTFIGLASCYSATGKKKKAINLLNKAKQRNPKNYVIYNNLGFTKLDLEEYESAIKDFDVALQLKPNYAYSYNNRGFAKLKLGQIDNALKDINFSLNLEPKNSFALKNKALCCMESGDKTTARKLLLQAKDLGYKKEHDNEVDDLLMSLE